ncbi:MAG: hypothetical protein K5985_00935 [Lachnospiraceae bacterium]|nr:hypothetical protein [Lachnospiraceae bacterium]
MPVITDTKPLILDFTGIYADMELERALGIPCEKLDLRHLRSVSMYVDEEAEEELSRLLVPFGYNGLHYLDNGNYHYVTRFFLRKIVSPFCLLVFDHHDDEQPPAFEGLKSCGSWIRDAKDELGEIPGGLMKSVMTVRGRNFFTGTLAPDLPVYCSVDKDVLSESECSVNWDQGSMRLEELKETALRLLSGRRLLGADICGECLPENPQTKETASALDRNRFVDVELYNFFKELMLREG